MNGGANLGRRVGNFGMRGGELVDLSFERGDLVVDDDLLACCISFYLYFADLCSCLFVELHTPFLRVVFFLCYVSSPMV